MLGKTRYRKDALLLTYQTINCHLMCWMLYQGGNIYFRKPETKTQHTINELLQFRIFGAPFTYINTHTQMRIVLHKLKICGRDKFEYR